jgi:SAM-dependent methyltransferase
MNKNSTEIKTHFLKKANFEQKFSEIINKINNSSSSFFTVEEQLQIVEDLASFPLGQYILVNKGSNGLWTDYLISPQEYVKEGMQPTYSLIENFLLFYSPTVIAQREIFKLSKKVANNLLEDGKKFASIPCGLMRDLLTLDFKQHINVSLVGIDADPESIILATELAFKLNVQNVSFFEKDAWNLDFDNEFHFINSIGLNVYEPDREAVIELYRQLHKALKPNGILFTCVLTWPPYFNKSHSEWKINKIPKFCLRLEELIFKEILDLKFLNFRKLNEIESDFKKAGFSKVEIYQDSLCVYPAVLATK